MPPDPRETRRRYDLTVGVYDSRYSEIQRRKYPILLGLLAPNPGELVLDWGCGTGLAIEPLQALEARLVGVDFSLGMLQHATRRGGSMLVLADCSRLPFGPELFDGVLAATVIQNIPDPERGLVEISRVLKLGGRAALSYPRRANVDLCGANKAGLHRTATKVCDEDMAFLLEKRR